METSKYTRAQVSRAMYWVQECIDDAEEWLDEPYRAERNPMSRELAMQLDACRVAKEALGHYNRTVAGTNNGWNNIAWRKPKVHVPVVIMVDGVPRRAVLHYLAGGGSVFRLNGGTIYPVWMIQWWVYAPEEDIEKAAP